MSSKKKGAQPHGSCCTFAGSKEHADALLDVVERLIVLYQASDVDSLDLQYGDMRLRLGKNAPQIHVNGTVPSLEQTEAATLQPLSAAVPAAATTTDDADASISEAGSVPSPAEEAAFAEENDSAITIVKAPLVGTFYAAPAPDAAPFVTEGQRVNEGDVLCIVEAMKLMNELCAPCSGIVESIKVANAQPLALDQAIMTIRS